MFWIIANSKEDTILESSIYDLVRLENREQKNEQRATEAKKRDREKNFWKNFLYSDSGKMN